jgi:hypothetical protein
VSGDESIKQASRATDVESAKEKPEREEVYEAINRFCVFEDPTVSK